jgi:transcriptional regulator with XRE-family HTH domain
MGSRIKMRQKELHIKQAELAETLEISNNHMSSIENGRQKPSLDTFIRLCDCLNVTPDYLLLGSMHAYNLPQDILDKLRLCSQEDIILARDFIELLVKRNRKKHITDSPISF